MKICTDMRVTALLMLLVLMVSCSFPGSDDQGTLVISFSSGRSITWMNDDVSLETSEVNVKLKRNGHTVEQNWDLQDDTLHIPGVSAGQWSLDSDGFNSEGVKVTMLQDGPKIISVGRGETVSVEAVMVPRSGSGTLNVQGTLDGAFSLLDNSRLEVSVHDINDQASGDGSASFSGDAASVSLDLDAGWYEVTASLYEGDLLYEHQVFILWMIPEGVIGEVTFTVASYDITYEMNGGDNHSDNPDAFTRVSEIDLQEPTRAGYEFAGWFYEAGFVNEAEVIGPGLSRDISLHAKWETE